MGTHHIVFLQIQYHREVREWKRRERNRHKERREEGEGLWGRVRIWSRQRELRGFRGLGGTDSVSLSGRDWWDAVFHSLHFLSVRSLKLSLHKYVDREVLCYLKLLDIASLEIFKRCLKFSPVFYTYVHITSRVTELSHCARLTFLVSTYCNM